MDVLFVKNDVTIENKHPAMIEKKTFLPLDVRIFFIAHLLCTHFILYYNY